MCVQSIYDLEDNHFPTFVPGLHKFAEGLSDFRDALVQCDETDIVKDLTKFISDLIACTEGSCVNFGIDIGVELIILYEHIYEIYGDIQAASNSFKIDAYMQGMTGLLMLSLEQGRLVMIFVECQLKFNYHAPKAKY